MPGPQSHRSVRTGWLRAAVLGANDGLISTSSLVVGVAAARSDSTAVLVAGLAGMLSGALSMAAGEYVSVSSQADADRADLALEQAHLTAAPRAERDELAQTYVARGVTTELAYQVADQLMEHDALEAHAREELGMHQARRARPVQAAFASAGSFLVGAAPPVVLAALLPVETLTPSVVVTALILLMVLGATASRLGGASALIGAVRVVFWGAVAMGVTELLGRVFGSLL